MSVNPLSTAAITYELATLSGWTQDGDVIVKAFAFGSFREALSFMVRVGFEAEARHHHPDWRNVYNEVTIRLSTHEAGGKVTSKDIDLARAIDAISWVK